jgi:hypothetical protein
MEVKTQRYYTGKNKVYTVEDFAKKVKRIIDNFFRTDISQRSRVADVALGRQFFFFFIDKYCMRRELEDRCFKKDLKTDVRVTATDAGLLLRTDKNKGYNHDTVLHAIKKIENYRKYDPLIKRCYIELNNKIERL